MELGTHHEIEYLPGGRIRHTQHLRPIAYHNGDGILKLIANDWLDGDQDSPHVVSAAPMRVRADGAGRRNIYPIPGNDEVYISIGRPWYQPAGGWQVAPMNPLERANNRLQSINPNYNLYLDHAGHFAKLGILLKGGFVPPNSRFAFPMSLVGLTRQGNTILHNGQPVMTLRRPVVYDFANPEDERPITFNFGAFGSQTGVIFNLPDMAGMSMPVVDPTLELQPDAADGMDVTIRSDFPTTNQGTAANLAVGDVTGQSSAAGRYCLKYDVSAIPSGSTITSVSAALFEYDSGDNTALGSWAVGMRRLLRNWVELQATWNIYSTSNNWGTAGAGSDGSDRVASDSASLTLDATAPAAFVTWSGAGLVADVQAWISGTANNYGWLWQAPTAENRGVSQFTYNLFRSSDHTTAAQRPKLTIEYTLPGGSGVFWPGVTLSAVFDGAIVR